MTHYLLWDIDGTLLSTARAGVYALEHAAQQVAGREVDLQGMRTAGMTDAQIAAAVIDDLGVGGGPEAVDAFLRAYEAALPERLHWRRGEVLHGVHDALEALDARDDVVNLLLTGNLEAGARAKLAHYDLDRFFAAGGAFCIADHDRADIARRALALVHEHAGGAVDVARDVTVIGDTPHDVSCGQAIGARTLAVATGGYTLQELRASGAWRAVERLPPPNALVALLGL
jgi:phosphoglycolate phosphatase